MNRQQRARITLIGWKGRIRRVVDIMAICGVSLTMFTALIWAALDRSLVRPYVSAVFADDYKTAHASADRELQRLGRADSAQCDLLLRIACRQDASITDRQRAKADTLYVQAKEKMDVLR